MEWGKEPIWMAADHAGFAYKEKIKDFIAGQGVSVKDLGPANEDRVDYPDFAAKVARAVSEGRAARGVLVCGSGIGMSIAANKFPGVRAACIETVYAARMCRSHNDVNVLCLGQRFLGLDVALEIVRTWMITSFEGGRHCARLDKIRDLERATDR